MTQMKTLLITALSVGVIGTGLLSTNKIFAQNSSTTGPMSFLVDKIASKFGLDTSDVQAVFDQERVERQAEMEKKYEEQLTQYVSEGKITEQQKQLILEKHKEMQAQHQEEREKMQQMTVEERKTAREANRTNMEEHKALLENWATQHGIDMQYVIGFGKRGGKGPGRDFHVKTAPLLLNNQR